jgi:hypothetical protein
MKIRPVGAELFRADGRTDKHDETNSRFSQFCERASNAVLLFVTIYLKKIRRKNVYVILYKYERANKLNK